MRAMDLPLPKPRHEKRETLKKIIICLGRRNKNLWIVILSPRGQKRISASSKKCKALRYSGQFSKLRICENIAALRRVDAPLDCDMRLFSSCVVEFTTRVACS